MQSTLADKQQSKRFSLKETRTDAHHLGVARFEAAFSGVVKATWSGERTGKWENGQRNIGDRGMGGCGMYLVETI